MRSRVTLAALLAATVFAAAACAGPLAPIDVGSKEVPIDLLLGAKVKKVVQAPLPPLALPTGPGGFVQVVPQPNAATVGSTLPTPTTTVNPGSCPEADPLAVPKRVAPNAVTTMPKAGTYAYRTTGRVKAGGANAQDVLLAPQSVVKIDAITTEVTGGFTYDMTVTNGTASTTTTYRVLPVGAPVNAPGNVNPAVNAGPPVGNVPPATKVPDEAPRPTGAPPGFYLAKVASPGALAFQPAPPGIPIARFPIDLGTVFDAAGSDGATTMSWRSTVQPKATVDACGTPIDTYTVELSQGRIARGSTTESLTFTSLYNLGTQYGGLPLLLKSDVAGTATGTTPVSRTEMMTINQEPAA